MAALPEYPEVGLPVLIELDPERMVGGLNEPEFCAAMLELAAAVYESLPHNAMSATSIVHDRANARWCHELAEGIVAEAERVRGQRRWRRNPSGKRRARR
jgi:hypothetical protein